MDGQRGEVSGVIWAALTMGIVRDWLQTLPPASTYTSDVLPPNCQVAQYKGGLVVGSIKITRHKIDILTTVQWRSFGRAKNWAQSIKPAAKCWEPKACGDRCGTKDLQKNMGQNMGPIWDKRFGKINLYLKSDAI